MQLARFRGMPEAKTCIDRYRGEQEMLDGLMLNLIRDACMNVVILAENTEEAGFARSIITREEIRKQLESVAQTAANLSPETHKALPKIDWDAWAETWRRMQIGGNEEHAAMWQAVRLLVPATLTWLRVYPKYQPDLFVFKPNTTACGEEPDKG